VDAVLGLRDLLIELPAADAEWQDEINKASRLLLADHSKAVVEATRRAEARLAKAGGWLGQVARDQSLEAQEDLQAHMQLVTASRAPPRRMSGSRPSIDGLDDDLQGMLDKRRGSGGSKMHLQIVESRKISDAKTKKSPVSSPANNRNAHRSSTGPSVPPTHPRHTPIKMKGLTVPAGRPRNASGSASSPQPRTSSPQPGDSRTSTSKDIHAKKRSASLPDVDVDAEEEDMELDLIITKTSDTARGQADRENLRKARATFLDS
jgi:hypothetical protein